MTNAMLKNKTSLEKTIDWIKKYRIPGSGVVVHHQTERVTQEVTGYLIPTLYNAGEKDLAYDLAGWEASVQQPDGSFLAPDGVKYTFDTAQVMRGFLAVINDLPELEENLRRSADYVSGNIDEKGEVHTCSYDAWKLNGSVFSPYCHLYVLPPLLETGKYFNEPRYVDAAHRALNRFKNFPDLVTFKPELGTISHIFGYILEALIDLGETDLARKGLAQAEAIQQRNGAIPAHPGVRWICSTGVAQLAISWFKSGNGKAAQKALDYLERAQNPSGGFYGSYGFGGKYFPGKEISWAAKYFVDAYHWKIKSSFENEINILGRIDENDTRLKEIIDFLKPIQTGKIGDIGCGKGRFLGTLKKHFPGVELHGMDIAENLLRFCPQDVHTACGSILNMPYPNDYFDGIFCVEALEHVIMVENAVRELVRILKPGGRLVIIDKNDAKCGTMRILSWEKWFDPEKITTLLKESGVNAHYKYIAGGSYSQADKLFIFWSGIKEK